MRQRSFGFVVVLHAPIRTVDPMTSPTMTLTFDQEGAIADSLWSAEHGDTSSAAGAFAAREKATAETAGSEWASVLLV